MATTPGKPRGYFQKLLALDCETTGFCFGHNPVYNTHTKERHQSVSWGVIVVDAATLKPLDELYVEIKWNERSLIQRMNNPKFGKDAEKIHGLSLEALEENGVEEEEAVTQIGNLILNHFGDGDIRLLGHNVVTFDRLFFDDLFRRHDINLKFGNRHIDTNTIGFVCYETFNSDDLFELIGITRETHNALEDARASLKVAQITRKLFKTVLEE